MELMIESGHLPVNTWEDMTYDIGTGVAKTL